MDTQFISLDGRCTRAVVGVGGFAIEINGSETLPVRLMGATKRFQLPGFRGEADLKLDLRWTDLSALRCSDVVFDSGACWRLIRQDEHEVVFTLHTPLCGQTPYKLARFDRNMKRGEIYFNQDFFSRLNKPVVALEYPLDELIMVKMVGLLGGVELHACGLEIGQKASMFFGPSGAGKSTIASLLQKHAGATILSDDRIVMREFGTRLRAFGTPWHGTARLAQAKSADVGSLFFLKQGPVNQARLLDPAQAVAYLASCSFMPFYDSQGMNNSLRFLERLVSEAAVYELTFYPDEEIAGFLSGMIASV